MSIVQGNSRFRVGDRVWLHFGRGKTIGVIVEDRGAVGAHGRRLFQVQVPMDPFEPWLVQLSEDEMEGVAASPTADIPLNKSEIMEYLKYGGLISILRANISGGRSQPRAWLCLDNLGNITHTFVPDRGMTGGEIVPFFAVQDDHVFEPKRAAVRTFIESFGLSRKEAEEVLNEVGTANGRT
jgi:hypothetical protein